MKNPEIIREPVAREYWMEYVVQGYGDMVKVVVDLSRGILGLGGEMHVDAEQLLLLDGSKQEELWGANVYPHADGSRHIEYDSMINIKPRQDNRSNTVQAPARQQAIEQIVNRLLL